MLAAKGISGQKVSKVAIVAPLKKIKINMQVDKVKEEHKLEAYFQSALLGYLLPLLVKETHLHPSPSRTHPDTLLPSLSHTHTPPPPTFRWPDSEGPNCP